MSTTTFEQQGPFLVSDLPALTTVPVSFVTRARTAFARWSEDRAFERALRTADPAMQGDLLALNRRR